jgi:MFS family permease
MVASGLFSCGLFVLAMAQGPATLAAGWGLMGLGMGTGLYEGAFATAVQLYGLQSRRPITAITLLGGLASTVCWPLTAWMQTSIGWRDTCLVWSAVHLLVILPLYALLSRSSDHRPNTGIASGGSGQETSQWAGPPESGDPTAPNAPLRSALLLSLIFALTWFISTAMAAHLPRLLQAQGIGLGTALLLGSLIGPAQVAGRLLEYTVLRHVHPLLSARLAGAMHPLGALVFLLAGAPLGALFAVMHGAGNGILTIAKGVLPLVLFGPQGYGLRQGLLMVPARFAQALAPLAFAMALDHWGGQALWLSAALGGLCLCALLALPTPKRKV